MVTAKSVITIVVVIVVLALLVVGGYFVWKFIENFRKGTGETCTFNWECNSGACERYRQKDLDERCCPSGAKFEYEKEEYCANLDPFSACTFNNQCASGACSRTDTIGLDLVCCPTGVMIDKGFYCGNLPNGTPCLKDEQCQSGSYCNNPRGIGGTCTAKGQPNTPCDIAQNSCVYACAASTTPSSPTGWDPSHPVCCPNNSVLSVDPSQDPNSAFNVCANLPANSICAETAQCASGLECIKNPGAVTGSCQAPRPVGDQCNVNSDCASKSCAYPNSFYTLNPLECCPQGNSFSVGASAAAKRSIYFCDKVLGDGEICWNNSQCVSDYCDGNERGITTGVCRTR